MLRTTLTATRCSFRPKLSASKAFSTTSAWHTINSLHTFTEEEELLRESVKRFAQDVVSPKVREMDENEMMDPSVINGLFEQALMGIETSAAHGGAVLVHFGDNCD